MTHPPTLSGYSTVVATTAPSLTVPLSSKKAGNLIVLFAELWPPAGGHNGSIPILPAGYQVLDSQGDTTSSVVVGWKISSGADDNPVIRAGYGAAKGVLTGSAEIFSGVDTHDPGYLEFDGSGGKFATVTRSAVAAAPSNVVVAARVAFKVFGVQDWVLGWGTGDMSFGLTTSDRPVMYLTNTVGGIIGNAPATADIPNLTLNRKVWLRATVVASTATCTYYYSYDDVENYEAVKWTILGAPVVGTNPATTVRVTNSTTFVVGTNSTLASAWEKNVYSVSETSAGTANLSWHYGYGAVLPAGHAIVGGVPHRAPTIGSSSPIEDFAFNSYTLAAPDAPTSFPPMTVYGPDRLIAGTVHAKTLISKHANLIGSLGTKAGDEAYSMVKGPADWTTYLDRSASSSQVFLRTALRTVTADATTEDAPYTIDANFVDVAVPWELVIALRPAIAPPPPPPASPQPPQLVLGCPTTYTAWITDGSYKQTIEQLHWSSISWERVLDAISSATVTIPDEYGGVNCLARAGGLEPWRYGLLIERDDQEVWSGPIITVARQGPAIQVQAADVFARYQKRFLIRDAVVDYDGVDAAEMFADILATHAASTADRWNLPVPAFEVGVPITRSLKPREFKYAWDLLSELLDSAVDAYVMNGVLYVWDPTKGWRYHFQQDQQARKGQFRGQLQAGPPSRPGLELTMEGTYNSDYDLIYGTFTEESFAQQPSWTLDGMAQTNFIVVPSTETGEFGFRNYAAAEDAASQGVYGVLDMVDPDGTETPADGDVDVAKEMLAARSRAIADLRSYPPITVEGGVLSQGAPINMDHLRPGGLWKIDIYDAGFGQLLSLLRLRRVSVSVQRTATGVSEAVSPTLEPPGARGTLAMKFGDRTVSGELTGG